MPEQISVAVIGAGMAGRSHAAAYRMANSVSGPGLPPIRLAAIADANVALAEDGARRYGYEKALPSWEAVAEDPSIDAVSIVVGNALHRPIAEALVKAGKHVLCEKPLAGSMEDARAMVELEKRGTVVTAVGYCYRRSPAIAAIRDHIRAGELGELTTLHARYWCDYACDPRGPLSWRFKGGMGPGRSATSARTSSTRASTCAARSRRCPAATCRSRSPSARCRWVRSSGTAPHRSAARWARSRTRTPPRSPRGSSRVWRPPSRCPAPRSACRTAWASTSTAPAGRCSFDFHRPAEYQIDDAQPEARTRGLRRVIVGPQMPYFKNGYPMEAPGVGIGNQEQFNYQARAFLDQIAGVADPLPPNATFADGLRSMEIIEAVVQSAQSDGAAVAVAPPA